MLDMSREKFQINDDCKYNVHKSYQIDSQDLYIKLHCVSRLSSQAKFLNSETINIDVKRFYL